MLERVVVLDPRVPAKWNLNASEREVFVKHNVLIWAYYYENVRVPYPIDYHDKFVEFVFTKLHNEADGKNNKFECS